jgi:hypothetical protein
MKNGTLIPNLLKFLVNLRFTEKLIYFFYLVFYVWEGVYIIHLIKRSL